MRKQWSALQATIITLGPMCSVNLCNLSSLYQEIAGIQFILYVSPGRRVSKCSGWKQCVCSNYPMFLRDLSTLSPELVDSQRGGDCSKATNLSVTLNKGALQCNPPHVNRDKGSEGEKKSTKTWTEGNNSLMSTKNTLCCSLTTGLNTFKHQGRNYFGLG